MDRVAVSSDVIAEIGYEAESQTLEVQFRRGTLYQYFGVPDFLFQQLMAAPSIGKFFNLEIKGRFSEARL